MDPITVLALLSTFTIIVLAISDHREYNSDDDLWLDVPSNAVPIPIDRGPRDAA